MPRPTKTAPNVVGGSKTAVRDTELCDTGRGKVFAAPIPGGFGEKGKNVRFTAFLGLNENQLRGLRMGRVFTKEFQFSYQRKKEKRRKKKKNGEIARKLLKITIFKKKKKGGGGQESHGR